MSEVELRWVDVGSLQRTGGLECPAQATVR